MRWVGLVWIALAASCVDPGGTPCSSGRLCPTGTVCDLAHDGCAEPGQLTACEGLGDGAGCTFRGNAGTCDQGVCLGVSCGDGLVTVGEACDDGNQQDGDGCSADCRSSEACGNGILDENLGEQCDCGSEEVAPGCLTTNSDEPEASCRANCTLQCGDGVVSALEECDGRAESSCLDFGFDHGALGCSSACSVDFDQCGRFGVQFAGGPGIADEPARGLWVAPTGEIAIVGGRHRAVLTGDKWNVEISGTSTTWTAVAGTGPDDVVAVGNEIVPGQQGRVEHWNGSQWEELSSPVGAVWTELADVWLTGDSNIYVVGGTGSVDSVEEGAVWHFDGSDWTDVLPNAHRPAGAILAIEPLGSGDDLVAVGAAGFWAMRISGTWSSGTTTAGTDLSSIYVVSDSEIYSVGGGSGIFRYDGSKWQQAKILSGGSLAAIGGIGSDLIYAVGPDGRVVHYDGERWLPMRTDSLAGFGSIFVAGGRIVVGARNFSLYQIMPGGWSDLEVDKAGRVDLAWRGGVPYLSVESSLYKLVGDAPEPIGSPPWGDENLMLAAATATKVFIASGASVYSYDEASKVIEFEDTLPLRPLALWAADGSSFAAAVEDARVYTWEDGGETGLAEVAPLDAGKISDLAGDGAGTLVATFESGAVYSNRTGSWQLEVDIGVPLRAVWMADTGEIFAGGDNGLIWAFDGSDWRPQRSASPERILDIHGASASDVFATSVSVIQRFDGEQWAPVSSSESAIWAQASSGDVYFASETPVAMRRLQRRIPW